MVALPNKQPDFFNKKDAFLKIQLSDYKITTSQQTFSPTKTFLYTIP